MKTLSLAAVLLLAITSVNAKSNSTSMSLKDGGSGSHGYTTNINGGEGNRPFKALNIYFGGGSGTRGGFTSDEGGAGSSGGGFHDTVESDGGGASSGGGYQLASEHGVERFNGEKVGNG
jgi:hypothetical protein